MATPINYFIQQNTRIDIDGRWVPARPMKGPLLNRIKDAWMVLIGRADAVTWYKQ